MHFVLRGATSRRLHVTTVTAIFFALQLGILLHQPLATGQTPPAQCVNWQQVFPGCPCIAAQDENGVNLPSVAVVDCSSKNFSSVPQRDPNFNFDRVLHELRLRDNQITTLLDDAFQGIKIRHIDLTGNSLGAIADNAFRGTEDELEILYIEGNSVGQPQKTALSKLMNLKELSMKNYNVSHLSDTQDQAYFYTYGQLTKLTLDGWGIVSIDPHAFLVGGKSNGPHTLRSLRLLNQNFPEIQVDILHEPELSNLETLQISHTKVKEISQLTFSDLNHLRELILSDNEITSIRQNSFASAGDTIETLDLSNNFLGATGPNDLPNLSQLTQLNHLSLRNNELTSVPKMANIANGQPLHVDLSNNKINTLSASDLESFGHRLKGLDLTLNQIVAVEDQTFNGVTLLQTLSLGSQNNPLRIPSSLNQAANSLTHLDLSAQDLEEATLWDTVRQLENLETLILHSTGISNIPDFSFRQMTNLKELDLGFNRISQINDKTFVGPRRLKKLSLKFNSISELPSCSFYQNTENIILDFQSIVIKCDCSVKKLLEYFQQGMISFEGQDAIPTCENTGISLPSVNPSSLSCPELTCTDYYVTMSPPVTDDPATDGPTTDNGGTTGSILTVQVTDVGLNSVNIAWTLSDKNGLRGYDITVSSSESDRTTDPISRDRQSYAIGQLTEDTFYSFCVNARFLNRNPVSSCVTQRTDATSPDSDSQSAASETGIIIGCVVGALILLVVIAIIVFCVVVRRRPKKASSGPSAGMTGPVQPRAFMKSELPSMNGDSKSFVKVKNNNNKGKGDLDSGKRIGGMQVVAISDGQTRPSAGRVGRAERLSSDGTYEPMDKSKSAEAAGQKDYEPMKKPYVSMSHGGNVNAAYENDHGALPPTPTKEQQFAHHKPSSPRNHGYYNEAFSNDKYEEITL